MEENKLAIQNELSHVDIRNLIYTIRGKQVMLDSDVAMLYHYETKNVNKAVKRNIDRFPEDFCFQLTKDEMDKMWFQNGTTSKGENNKYRSEKYLPYAFTEQGIAMLSGVLKNDIAIEVSINIMRAFIEMRKFINTNKNLFEKVINIENKMDKKFIEQDKKFDIIFDQLQLEENIKQRIFFDGQIYDAYSLIIDIIKRANKKILIIDNYIDDSVLKMLAKKKKHVEVVILTSDKTNIQNIDIQKFNKEYPILKVSKTNKFHDRFIVIDNREMYHLGASIKDLGKKCFAILCKIFWIELKFLFYRLKYRQFYKKLFSASVLDKFESKKFNAYEYVKEKDKEVEILSVIEINLRGNPVYYVYSEKEQTYVQLLPEEMLQKIDGYREKRDKKLLIEEKNFKKGIDLECT